MLILVVETLNNTYRIEQNDAGEQKVISTTNDAFRELMVGKKVLGRLTVGKPFWVKGVHSSNIVSIWPEH